MSSFKSIDGMGVAMIGAVVGLLYVAGVRPLQATYADAVKLKAELWIASNELSERQTSESKATTTAQKLSDRLEQLAIELSNIDQMNTRLAELTQLAEQSGLTIEAVRPGEQVSKERYRAVLITLIGRTGYEQAGTFLIVSEEPVSFVPSGYDAPDPPAAEPADDWAHLRARRPPRLSEKA